MRLLIVMFLVLGCAHKSNFNHEKNRAIASVDFARADAYLQGIVESSIDVYAHHNYTIDIANSDDAIQFTVNHHKDDAVNLYGFGGIRKRNLHIQLNEQYIAWQEKSALNKGKNFDVANAKRVLIQFREN